MRKILLAAVVVAAAVSSFAAAPASTPKSDRDWRATTVGDVKAAYQLYVDNHPGMDDPLNPGFAASLAHARDEALGVAEKAHNRADYAKALATFTGSLSDGHAQVYAKQKNNGGEVKRLWPGFVAAWRGDGMIVHRADPSFPMDAGSSILSCDGKPVDDLVKRRLVGGFRVKEAGQWWSRSPQAFMAIEGYTDDAPKSCRFRSPKGEERDVALSFQPAPAGYSDWLNAATDGERTPIGLSTPRPGVFLVGLPDFQPDQDGIKAYRSLFDEVAKRRSELAGAKAIVLDLRHNNGGSSSWSRQLAAALWGADVDSIMSDYFKDVQVWWRASKGNTDYMTDLEAKVRADGNADVADSIHTIGAGMKASLAKGAPFFVEADDPPAAAAVKATAPLAAPVYVITPGRCASACLDAIDTFKRFPNVKLIGAPTSGDSTYMEVRSQDLPSGEGRIVIPIKEWMKRPRGSGEIYRPDIMMTGADWSTAAFLDRVEADLRR